MSIIGGMLRAIDEDVGELQDGLQPENLAEWYDRLVAHTIEMAPPWLEDKVRVVQDPVLPMKFELDISKRAVRYFMMAVDDCSDSMPYTTRLYFLKVQEALASEMDRSLV